MNQIDYCQCGGSKVVFVTTIDGATNAILPGTSQHLPRDVVNRIECACSHCGLLYSLHSLMSPVEFYE
ncbi:hypothetical protein [Marinobacter alexandrii]|uniref:hypothetical protein n=1 Tax=Marinobacter alexandrii TaxID=2570351 RepID=UPI00110833A7|nr:hypothetical protein [Marinobacter alexandrii]